MDTFGLFGVGFIVGVVLHIIIPHEYLVWVATAASAVTATCVVGEMRCKR